MRRTALSAEHELGDLDDTDFVICDETIENQVHWVLDVVFHEDASRIRAGHAAENVAVVRHIALNLLRHQEGTRMSLKAKRLRAGWDTDFLLQVFHGN